jgi:hypothetical protein
MRSVGNHHIAYTAEGQIACLLNKIIDLINGGKFPALPNREGQFSLQTSL